MGPSSANTEGPPRLGFSLTETLGGLAQHDGSAASERGTPVARLADLGAGLDAEEAERPAREPTQADHGGATSGVPPEIRMDLPAGRPPNPTASALGWMAAVHNGVVAKGDVAQLIFDVARGLTSPQYGAR